MDPITDSEASMAAFTTLPEKDRSIETELEPIRYALVENILPGPTGDIDVPKLAKFKAEHRQLLVPFRQRVEQPRDLADQAHGVNLDLGWDLLNGLSKVDPLDINVARFFVYALLGLTTTVRLGLRRGSVSITSSAPASGSSWRSSAQPRARAGVGVSRAARQCERFWSTFTRRRRTRWRPRGGL
jgi:hypothetical protein